MVQIKLKEHWRSARITPTGASSESKKGRRQAMTPDNPTNLKHLEKHPAAFQEPHLRCTCPEGDLSQEEFDLPGQPFCCFDCRTPMVQIGGNTTLCTLWYQCPFCGIYQMWELIPLLFVPFVVDTAILRSDVEQLLDYRIHDDVFVPSDQYSIFWPASIGWKNRTWRASTNEHGEAMCVPSTIVLPMGRTPEDYHSIDDLPTDKRFRVFP